LVILHTPLHVQACSKIPGSSRLLERFDSIWRGARLPSISDSPLARKRAERFDARISLKQKRFGQRTLRRNNEFQEHVRRPESP